MKPETVFYGLLHYNLHIQGLENEATFFWNLQLLPTAKYTVICTFIVSIVEATFNETYNWWVVITGYYTVICTLLVSIVETTFKWNLQMFTTGY